MIELKPINENNLDCVKEVYDYYILNSTATFHTEPVTIDEIKTFLPVEIKKYPSFLVCYNDEVCGYCFINRYKARSAYDRTAEITIYLQPEFLGKGIGKEVLVRMEKIAIENGIAVLIALITSENTDSIKTFEKLGYEKCAHLKQVGEKFGRILDVVFYQKILKKLS